VPSTYPASGAAAPEPKLYRANEGRLIAGVARGLADHLRVDVRWVRLGFLLLSLVNGAGILIYGALWFVVPVEPTDNGEAADDSGRSRASWMLLLSLGAVGVGLALVLQLFGAIPASSAPLVMVVVGAGLVWLRTDDEQRRRFTRRASGRDRSSSLGWLQLVAGLGLVVVGALAFLAARGTLVDVGRAVLSGFVMAIGLALLLAPWALGVLRDRDAERRARIRSEERAEIAAHIHDSVLQTLTLIQRSADDAGAVTRLARAQERDLRHLLYEPVPDASATLRGALEAAAADVEDVHGVALEFVCVGDVPMDDRLASLVMAAREAMVNAAKYGGRAGGVSVYAEVDGGDVSVSVRDRGPGFDLAAVPADRRGVRDSILGRMERHGGQASVRPMDGAGTQVELQMKVSS